MKYFAEFDEKALVMGAGHKACPIISKDNSCVNGCITGISIYQTEEYAAPGIHDDHEGFFVIEGTGAAKVGEEEFRISPNMSFIAPAGVAHAIKKDADSCDVKIFWFHFPA